MTPHELKASILQQAIQGKLVEQRSEEGTAEKLFQQIQAEKQALIKADKIKKGKAYPVIGEEEIPFDIPDTWIMARLQDVVYNRGQEVPSETFCYIDIGSIDNKRQKLNAEDNVLEASNAPSRARKIVQLGDILYSTVRPYLHNMCIIDREFSYKPIASTGFAAMTCYEGIYNKYLFYYLLSPIFDSYANDTENAKGVAYPAINDDRLYRAVIAIPPHAEQKRIVAKLEEILPLIDRYEAAWNKLEEFNKRFPMDMQKSILQMAIQGKLVPQLPKEGTGEELFQQIQAEKQRLIKAGKIKKEKPLPEITEDELPFDIPDSWKWVRLSQLFSVLNGDRGKNYPAKSTLSHEGIPFISALNLDGKSIIEDDNLLCLSEQQYEKLGNGKLIRDDIVVCIRGSLGKHGRYPFDKGAIASSLVILRAFTNDDVLAEFLMMYLDTPLFFSEIRRYDNGTAQPNLAAKSLEQFLVPLPPLAEQKRIVDKLEEILPLCERLK